MQLMWLKKTTVTGFIELESHKWLCRVEKEGLLNLLWVSHYHHTAVTIFFIRHLLFLAHDGCLWLEEPIPITDHLIHRITQLPCKGDDPPDISKGKNNNFSITEAMKKKFKLENKRGYTISSINNNAVRVSTQILASKVMRKCRANAMPTLVVALATQCTEGDLHDIGKTVCDFTMEALQQFTEENQVVLGALQAQI